MNFISQKKLLNTKWTATQPINKEKHFVVSKVKYNEDGIVIRCLIEAVLTRNSYNIVWQDLKNQQHWLSGWQ